MTLTLSHTYPYTLTIILPDGNPCADDCTAYAPGRTARSAVVHVAIQECENSAGGNQYGKSLRLQPRVRAMFIMYLSTLLDKIPTQT